MGQPLENTLAQIAIVARTVTGIRQVSQPPIDSPNAWPQIAVYARSGAIEAAPIGSRKALHVVVLDLLVPEQQSSLDRQIALLTPFLDTIPAALIAQVSDSGGQFSGTISTFGQIEYSFTVTNYAGVPCRGYSFVMRDVKILQSS